MGMNIEQHFERIESYTEGGLSPAEKQSFERELTENAELKQAYGLYQMSLDAIETGIGNQLRQELKQWEKSATSNAAPQEAKVVSFTRRLVQYGAAAAILLLVGFFSWQFLQKPVSPETLYGEYYELPSAGSIRSVDPGTKGAMDQGRQAFGEKNFAQAAQIFSSIPSNDPAYAEAQYLLGHADCQLQQFAAARAAFAIAAAQNDFRIKEKAEWYGVVSCLRVSDQPSGCGDALAAIAENSDHAYYDSAVALQKKTSKVWEKNSER
jgi:Tetratricopeptide repeat